MMTAVDGRIDCAMTEQLPGVQEYYSTLDSLAAPSRVSGRVTAQLEMARPGTFEPQDAALGHESFSRNADADGYEIVIDTRGTPLWDEPDASERVSRAYLAYLGGLHISWIACGKERVDLARACEILASAFGVERMAVVGGGHINTAFPATLTRQATSTNSSGERLSPSPRKMAESRLYATMKKVPPPQMRT